MNRLSAKVLAVSIALLFVAPLLVGLAGTLLPAFGWMPSLAPVTQRANGFHLLLADPRVMPALWLSLKTGLLATLLAFVITLLALVSTHGTRLWRWLSASLPPLLAVPHAAMAVGLVFLLSPSGWLVRLVSPGITGWARPPTEWVVPDAGGWSLIIGLAIKETPFLLLAVAAQLPALNVEASLKIGRTLGYAPARCWSRLILPRLYPRIRLTLLIMLAFNLSVVDMALLLGPGNPPTFSVFLLSLVNDPGSRAAASAGALLLALGVATVFLLLYWLERAVSRLARHRRQSGARGHGSKGWRRAGQVIVAGFLLISVLALTMLPLWSVVNRWRFPDSWPGSLTLDHWMGRYDQLLQPALTTIGLAGASALLAVVAAIAWLELERRGDAPRVDALWYVPLLIPQVTLLFGWQAGALLLSVEGVWATVAWSHWVYTLPYVVLILAVAWREFDSGWEHSAAVLGAGYWRRLVRIRLPMMIRPLCQALAVAVAVSVAQYLPTLLLGAGRYPTLATELVTSFGGVDRRVIAALAVLQSLLPLAAFVLALQWPRARTARLRRRSRAASLGASA